MSACKVIHVELELIVLTSSDRISVSAQWEQLAIHCTLVNRLECQIVKDLDAQYQKHVLEDSFATVALARRKTLVVMTHSVHLKILVSM